jgi:hypothetical protein
MNNDVNCEKRYGVTIQNQSSTALEYQLEEFNRNGFTIVDSGYDADTILKLQGDFDSIRKKYKEQYSLELLQQTDEHNGIRLPLSLDAAFLDLVFNENVLAFVELSMGDNFILNQQNGVINPANSTYNQAAWHRDLPYQHFTSSKPLAINALYCVDDFTLENGGTKVIPGSHLHDEYPSEKYLQKHKMQAVAKAGSFIVLNCMLYHAGEANKSKHDRRAVNHVYASPMIRQQIDLKKSVAHYDLSEMQKKLLGINFNSVSQVSEYIHSRIPNND